MAESGTYVLKLPALNPRLATLGEGRQVGSCLSSAWNAWSRSNYHLPNIWIANEGYDYFFGEDRK